MNALPLPNRTVIDPRRNIGRCLLITAAWLPALALPLLAVEVMPPKPARFFNDYAGVVPQNVAGQLNEQLAQYERDSSNQLLVAIFQKMQTD